MLLLRWAWLLALVRRADGIARGVGGSSHQRTVVELRGGDDEDSESSILLVDDWDELSAFARSAALTYYEATTIVAAHERWWYERSADSVHWAMDGYGLEARWGRTSKGSECNVIVRELPEAGMRYFVRTERGADGIVRQHVSIKGSDNAKNFRDDVDYAKVVDKVCRARLHRGFKRVADAVWDDAAGFLERDAQFELTGHSLGGGVATILGMRLVAQGASVTRVVTFGAPKVTNAHGVGSYAARLPVLRVLTADDPVPTLPSMDVASQVFGFYRHFGHRLILYDDDDHEVVDTLGHVFLSPVESSGMPRMREVPVGAGRFSWRPDPRMVAERHKEKDFVNVLQGDWRKKLIHSTRNALGNLALWHLDESFFWHAHHVSPTAHVMDAYEKHLQTRAFRSEAVFGFRRKHTRKTIGRKAPFVVLTTLAGHRLWKWRNVLKVLKPKYLVMSLLFVGWTGAGGQSRHQNFQHHHHDKREQGHKHPSSSSSSSYDLPPEPSHRDHVLTTEDEYGQTRVLRHVWTTNAHE